MNEEDQPFIHHNAFHNKDRSNSRPFSDGGQLADAADPSSSGLHQRQPGPHDKLQLTNVKGEEYDRPRSRRQTEPHGQSHLVQVREEKHNQPRSVRSKALYE